MALRSCLVSCRDLGGTEHAVEVTAESLYEAVAQALGITRKRKLMALAKGEGRER